MIENETADLNAWLFSCHQNAIQKYFSSAWRLYFIDFFLKIPQGFLWLPKLGGRRYRLFDHCKRKNALAKRPYEQPLSLTAPAVKGRFCKGQTIDEKRLLSTP